MQRSEFMMLAWIPRNVKQVPHEYIDGFFAIDISQPVTRFDMKTFIASLLHFIDKLN